MQIEHLLTIQEVAEILHVSPRTVEGWISSKLLYPVHVGRCVRIDQEYLRTWIRDRQERGPKTYRRVR
jgi:excisionase family DNA binding protein